LASSKSKATTWAPLSLNEDNTLIIDLGRRGRTVASASRRMLATNLPFVPVEPSRRIVMLQSSVLCGDWFCSSLIERGMLLYFFLKDTIWIYYCRGKDADELRHQ
jgi:hypothetical protein